MCCIQLITLTETLAVYKIAFGSQIACGLVHHHLVDNKKRNFTVNLYLLRPLPYAGTEQGSH